jgi:hypothetical protein
LKGSAKIGRAASISSRPNSLDLTADHDDDDEEDEESSHLDGAELEKIVPAGHPFPPSELAILEIKRIETIQVLTEFRVMSE